MLSPAKIRPGSSFRRKSAQVAPDFDVANVVLGDHVAEQVAAAQAVTHLDAAAVPTLVVVGPDVLLSVDAEGRIEGAGDV